MDVGQVRQAVTALREVSALLNLESRNRPYLERVVEALDQERTFMAYSTLGNTAAAALAAATDGSTRQALGSIALEAYQYCVDHSTGTRDFSPSRNQARDVLDDLGGPLDITVALETLYEVTQGKTAPAADPGTSTSSVAADSALPPPTPAASSNRQGSRFEEAVQTPLPRRLADQLLDWRAEGNPEPNEEATKLLELRISRLLAAGEEGRSFGGFALLREDLDGLTPELSRLDIPRRPQAILERAQASRAIANVDFRSADEADYRASRRAWLLAAFWNSNLTELWATNEEQVTYDFLGYLTAVQAEHRYTTHDEFVLLLLRVSHLICRIASSEDRISTSVYENFGNLEAWVRFTVGTVLAISGPGRVPPSRVRNDPRLTSSDGAHPDRDEYGMRLLPSWRSTEEREAASAILLELASWSLSGAERLVRSVLKGEDAEIEVWVNALREVDARADRVRVLRPNPWAETVEGKLITADTHALAVLASDVIHRTFPSLGGDISLNGTSFKDRRVPTFICFADFGPLGLFKADSRQRILREAENFTKFAQRLHPRYRASRSDRSVATISEPDDRIEFVSGLLTSYVFTESEAPRSLNNWLRTVSEDAGLALVRELFVDALKPWYQHASLGTVDLLQEYEPFSKSGLKRLQDGLGARQLQDANDAAVEWLSQIVGWVTGYADVDPGIQEQAARLQLCETLRSVTHGDLHLDNVMVLGRPGAEYPCLIDFEATGQGHLLRDLGRFSGAVLFRVHDWDDDEKAALTAAFLPDERPDRSLFAATDAMSTRAKVVVSLLELTWSSYLHYWRSGTEPGDLELAACLVCSFLPFARYPDTSLGNSRLALDLSAEAVSRLMVPR